MRSPSRKGRSRWRRKAHILATGWPSSVTWTSSGASSGTKRWRSVAVKNSVTSVTRVRIVQGSLLLDDSSRGSFGPRKHRAIDSFCPLAPTQVRHNKNASPGQKRRLFSSEAVEDRTEFLLHAET